MPIAAYKGVEKQRVASKVSAWSLLAWNDAEALKQITEAE